ncbi:putative transcriptional regulatory protein NarL [compost metagenome]
MLGLAPLIASCITRHYAFDTDGESSFRGAVTDELSEICPQLTVREREVVQRILDGATTERIAEDLSIRPTTVITYRTRAYEKLGVSSRRELFATVLRKRNVAAR